ncbi:hypothetical protein K523DRAFT_82731 [Schizophyllum commune Tattone D]|nr:hypothetical protein K523DRAFT_82731 [Schizophyllum commune Tattone D]
MALRFVLLGAHGTTYIFPWSTPARLLRGAASCLDTQRKLMLPLKEHLPTALCCPRSRRAHETHCTLPGYAPVGLLRRSTPSLRGYLMHGHTLITPLYSGQHPSIQGIPVIPTSVGVRKVFLKRPRPAHQLVYNRPADLPVRPSLSPSTRHLLSRSFPYQSTLTHLFFPTHPGLPLSSHRVFPLPSSL